MRLQVNTDFVIETLTRCEWRQRRDEVMAMEELCYEPARRDPADLFDRITAHDSAIATVALCAKRVVGFCFAGPLEWFEHVVGPWTEPPLGLHSTLYAADLTVAPEWQRRGIGFALKRRQLHDATARNYRYVVGRNRVGFSDAMIRLNRRLGARVVDYFAGSYGDGLDPDMAVYYRIKLRRAR